MTFKVFQREGGGRVYLLILFNLRSFFVLVCQIYPGSVWVCEVLAFDHYFNICRLRDRGCMYMNVCVCVCVCVCVFICICFSLLKVIYHRNPALLFKIQDFFYFPFTISIYNTKNTYLSCPRLLLNLTQ